VLASKRANADKSDHIAGCEHLLIWAKRNAALQLPKVTVARVTQGAPPADWATARSVAAWMYEAAERDQVQAWQSIGDFGKLDGTWRRCLAAG